MLGIPNRVILNNRKNTQIPIEQIERWKKKNDLTSGRGSKESRIGQGDPSIGTR